MHPELIKRSKNLLRFMASEKSFDKVRYGAFEEPVITSLHPVRADPLGHDVEGHFGAAR